MLIPEECQLIPRYNVFESQEYLLYNNFTIIIIVQLVMTLLSFVHLKYFSSAVPSPDTLIHKSLPVISSFIINFPVYSFSMLHELEGS